MKLLLTSCLALLLSGCYTSSMMQTAKTLDKGEREFTVGAGPYTSSGDILASPDFMLRWGISDKSDFGIGYSLQLNGHIRADWKRELWSSADQRQFLSSGVMADVFIPNDFAGDPVYIGICAPLYYSFNHHKKRVPYFGQRISLGLRDLSIIRYAGVNEPITERVSLYHQMYYSGAAGIRFGQNRFKWFIEASYSLKMEHIFRNYFNTDASVDDWQLSRGYDRDVNAQITLGMTIGRKG
ncbi:MAG: hypothetical protein NXI10_12125 [bacterium]|nr:hypothetical protein [bacterium]